MIDSGPAQKNFCEDCGIWSKCRNGFSRWVDQKDCKYAIKSDYRDQCRHTNTETGFCDNQNAQEAARNREK
jgi:hypothetical protein